MRGGNQAINSIKINKKDMGIIDRQEPPKTPQTISLRHEFIQRKAQHNILKRTIIINDLRYGIVGIVVQIIIQQVDFFG